MNRSFVSMYTPKRQLSFLEESIDFGVRFAELMVNLKDGPNPSACCYITDLKIPEDTK